YSLDHYYYHDTAPTEIYTLSLHDALPISEASVILAIERLLEMRHNPPEQMRRAFSKIFLILLVGQVFFGLSVAQAGPLDFFRRVDRKSTRLNSSHLGISYAVFCLKKKKEI